MGSKDAEVMKEGIIMKKLMTLALAAAMMLGAATGASAIDFKAKGQWLMTFDYGQHGNFSGKQTGFGTGTDEFSAQQRVRLQLDAVASEALSGTAFFEIGKTVWGKESEGGALGADSNNVVKLKNAYIDWMVPQTDLKVRMGIQGLALPGYTMGNQVFFDDVAAVTLNYQFNENVGVTAFWARPYNDNAGYASWGNNPQDKYSNYMDNMDIFALLVPLTFDGVKATPWVMYSAIGSGTFNGRDANGRLERGNYDFYGTSGKYAAAGMVSGFGTGSLGSLYGNAIWAGLTGEVTLWDPFRIAWDFTYGSVAYDNETWNRQGWMASLLLEYKLDWATPGLYGWYSSGDDDDTGNGSERLPSISTNNLNNGFSNFAFNGNPYNPRAEGVLSYNMSGTWGIGARLKDMSFLEDLKHTLYVNFIGGTNNTDMAAAVDRANIGGYGAAGFDPIYMTTEDYALEIGLSNSYKMYDNFTIFLDAAYIALWMDDSHDVWGHNPMRNSQGRDTGVYDAWNVNLTFAYSF